jgi:hypothetical protein
MEGYSMKKRIFLAALLTISLMVMFFSSAFAQQPIVETFAEHQVFSVDCGGFQAQFDDFVTFRITYYSDENGNPNEFRAHLRFDGTLTHSGTGQSLRDKASIIVSGQIPFDYRNEAERGVGFHITVPGKGVVLLLVGRLLLDENGQPTFEGGKNWAREHTEGFDTVVCEALADL